VANLFLGIYGVEDVSVLFQEGFSRRGAALSGVFTLIILIGTAFAVLWPQRAGEDQPPPSRSSCFAVLLVVFGGLLVLIPEFIYLRDLFLTRMNTIFKFYYQAWLMWGVAAAYASALLLTRQKERLVSSFYLLVFVMVLFVGLTYPAMALNTRIVAFQSFEAGLELDGTNNDFYLNPDEKAAAAWLRQAPTGTLVESVGGSYTVYARISMNTGQPALLGWVGHEGQWRGGGDALGNRQTDIERLYTTPHWEEAVILLRMYNIRYIVVGNLEYATYQVNEEKFTENLEIAFQQGSVTIYETSGWED
jgi:uncharacterized membrane protein